MNEQLASFDWLPALGVQVVELAIKSILLMVAVTALALLFRRSSAATRHCIWTLGLVATLCLPLLNLCLPRIGVPGIPSLDEGPTANQSVAAASGAQARPASL